MELSRFWLTDFRNYTSAAAALAPGLTVVLGANGEGKTNLLEAISYMATLSSFRGAPSDALIRMGCPAAVVRLEGMRERRSLLLEAELRAGTRDRVQINRQPLRRARDLLGALRVTVFSPDDLAMVKGGPAERRRFLDQLLVAVRPRFEALQSDLERIVRQRTSLLKQAGGHLGPEMAATLDVWDAKLARAGEELVAAREELVTSLEPELAKAYTQVAAKGAVVGVSYARSWEGDLALALDAARTTDLRRGATTVGPHRDDLGLFIDGMPCRTHASQGEQRSMALALRLSGHAVVREAAGTTPVLLLDDVFSELDADRADALVTHLPVGQAVLTTALTVPAGADPDLVLRVNGGRIS